MLCSYMSLNLLSFVILCFSFFFFNDTATTEIYTLSLHDALPIYFRRRHAEVVEVGDVGGDLGMRDDRPQALPIDRKSTRLNSSHGYISYAVFCLKKKKNTYPTLIHSRHIIRTCVISD